MENSNNISMFATELSQFIGQIIGVDHIHSSDKGRYFYIQAPQPGAPMLLHHYRGPYFVDMHPDDYENLVSGKVSPHEYIMSANWQVGYYWGGGNMVGGGYYQPMDIIKKKNEVRRYLKILSCRGGRRSSGYMPSEQTCAKCSIQNCPFSKYKTGNWENELQEPDPRIDLFKALRTRFEQEYAGYTLHGFIASKIPEEEIWLSPKTRFSESEPISFSVYASNELIRDLLMHEIEPEDWDDFAWSFTFKVNINQKLVKATAETLKKSYQRLPSEKPVEEVANVEVKLPLLARIMNRFKR